MEQDIPTVFVIDGTGLVRFKYVSQNTFDRPSAGYLVQVARRLVIPDAPATVPAR